MKEIELRLPEELPSDFIDSLPHRFTLIVGEVKSGKTTLTGKILEAYRQTYGGSIVVVDLAPEVLIRKSAMSEQAQKVGGKLRVCESETVHLFHEKILAPRLTAKSEEEAEVFAQANRLTIERIFAKALSEKPDALFVNDCSLYLHAGIPERLLERIRTAKTAVVNGYFGKTLGEGRISRREREGMEFLIDHCDRLIRLEK